MSPDASSEVSSDDVVVMIYKDERVLVPRPDSYEHARRMATQGFLDLKDVSADDIAFFTDILSVCQSKATRISPLVWDIFMKKQVPVMVSLIKKSEETAAIDIVVMRGDERHVFNAAQGATIESLKRQISTRLDTPIPHQKLYSAGQTLHDGDILKHQMNITLNVAAIPTVTLERTSGPKFRVEVVSCALGNKCTFMVSPRTQLGRVFQLFEQAAGISSKAVRYVYDGYGLHPSKTFAEYSIEDGDCIDAMVEQLGGKPVIYLLPPRPLLATVELALIPAWSFSVLYPLSPTSSKVFVGYSAPGEVVEWVVDVKPNGDMVDKRTSVEVSYLFWEAHTRPVAPDSPPSSRPNTPSKKAEAFDPSTADLSPSNSAMLPTERLPGYLASALKALGLHTEARTSFVTYWLPSFLRHSHVAFRFVSQASYECAAPLNIIPKPDVVTRVFMIFKGVGIGDKDNWADAAKLAEVNVDMWKDVVGIDEKKVHDRSLFRVLEWGGMEVLR